MSQLLPILRWAAILGLVAVGAAAGVGGRRVRRPPALRGRGGIVLLTAILLAGTPGLIMDMRKSERYPNGGAYAVTALPRSRVEAARWVRDNSAPDDVLATNAHCRAVGGDGVCDARSFWLSAYAERRVLVEGWLFAPRVSETGERAFWDPALLALNDEAFTAPTPPVLDALRARGRAVAGRRPGARPRVTGAAGAGPAAVRQRPGRGLRADLSIQRGAHAHHPEARRHPGRVVDHVAVHLAERLAGKGDERLRPAYVLAAVVVRHPPRDAALVGLVAGVDRDDPAARRERPRGHLQQVPALVVGEVVQEPEQEHRVGGRDVGEVLLAEDLAA